MCPRVVALVDPLPCLIGVLTDLTYLYREVCPPGRCLAATATKDQVSIDTSPNVREVPPGPSPRPRRRHCGKGPGGRAAKLSQPLRRNLYLLMSGPPPSTSSRGSPRPPASPRTPTPLALQGNRIASPRCSLAHYPLAATLHLPPRAAAPVRLTPPAPESPRGATAPRRAGWHPLLS
jgi:hypothetical protein